MTHRRILSVLETNLISLANRRCCEDIFELIKLLLVITALFIGNGILLHYPKE